MTTKTVVCPECGSAAASGRYACAECGALLAAVAGSARTWRADASSATPAETAVDGGGSVGDPEDPTVPAAAVDFVTGAEPESAVADEPAPQPVAVAELAPADPGAPSEPAWPDRPVMPAFGRARATVNGNGNGNGHRNGRGRGASRGHSPLDDGSLVAIEEEPVDPPVREEPAPAIAAEVPDTPAFFGAPAVAATTAAEPGPSPAMDQVMPAALRSWPPAAEVAAPPLGRTPAGAYLPPSAVLPPLDAPSTSVVSTTAANGRDPRAAALGMIDSLGIEVTTARRVVAAGAVLAGLGFILPWAPVLPGSGQFGGYFAQWGLAGPGAWIAVGLLAALGVVALGHGRLASWPVGLAAVALAALLVGIVWPFLFGLVGHAVGVWVVLAGAVLLVVGAALDGPSRHATDGPPV